MRETTTRSLLAGLLVVSSVFFPFSSTRAENDVEKALITLQKKSKSLSNQRPKAPDRQVVTCAYDGDSLHLSFAIPEGIAAMTITDRSMQILSYEFDTTPLEVTVTTGTLIGTVNIELTTEKGNTFIGTLK